MLNKTLAAVAVSAAMLGSAHAAPLYNPVGAQANVAIATVLAGGWTQCYQQTMGAIIGNNAENVTTPCAAGDLIMMAGRVTGSSTLLSLAAGEKSQVLFDTGANSTTHTVNGAEWWYSPNWSWGFTALGDTVTNSSCDTSSSPLSMCLHTVDFTGGYRINDITGLNQSTAYEKLFFVADSRAAVPEPMSLALLGLGLAGLGLARRRKSA